MADRHPDKALSHWRALASTKDRAQIGRNIAPRIAEADPAMAVTLIETELSGWYRSDSARKCANELAESDPLQGANFALRFQDPRLLILTVTEAVKVFNQRDPEGLAQWVRGLPEGTAREAALATSSEFRVQLEGETRGGGPFD